MTSRQGIHRRMTRDSVTRFFGRKVLGRRAMLAFGLIGAGGAVLIAGCSTTSTSSATKSPTASPSPSPSTLAKTTCVHINSLRGSLTHLTTIKVSQSSASQLTADLTNIEKQLTALKGEDLGAFSGQAAQLTSALNQIKKSFAQVSKDPTAAYTELGKEITTLKSRSGPMIAQMKTVCKNSG
jgi:peptidoglycan hydrolase CwlO-like protein